MNKRKAGSSRQKQGARNDKSLDVIEFMVKLQRGLMFALGVILMLGTTVVASDFASNWPLSSSSTKRGMSRMGLAPPYCPA